MLTVGLTGGIGAGKSTFAALLAERGAQIIDADLIGSEAMRPGRQAWHDVVETFGDEVLAEDGMEIDRPVLADIVFPDPHKLAALNAIVHPVIVKHIADELDLLHRTDEIVVVDAALISEFGMDGTFDVVVAVVADDDARRERLRRKRGMTMSAIRARMAVQADPSVVAERADIVVANNGTPADLAAEADRVWAELTRLRDA